MVQLIKYLAVDFQYVLLWRDEPNIASSHVLLENCFPLLTCSLAVKVIHGDIHVPFPKLLLPRLQHDLRRHYQYRSRLWIFLKEQKLIQATY
jgi:hypothetical protein